MNRPSAIEPLESRIAPAVTIIHPISDITAGIGQTGATIDLGKMVDPTANFHTFVEFQTNFTLPGETEPAKIVIELFDDKAPLTVQNFLSYVNGTSSNYDGTFFHRIFDFQNDGNTDIIQAGGFDVSNLKAHIPTGPTVHNEYGGVTDPDLRNTRGTIAMAKTAVSPHTASSEWFINLSDNSSILDETNNGGFTVFGIIREGFDVIDAIGDAQKRNLSGVNDAFTDIAVQNGYVSGKPTANQLIQIVDAKVIPSDEASAEGHAFTDAFVTEVGSSTTSNLLIAEIVPGTNELKLTYAPGATGVAEVTVKVEKDNQTVFEKFTVTIKPNLISELTTHNLPTTFVPGDSGVAKVKVTNNLGGLAKGQVEVRLYLSQVDVDGNNQVDANAFILDDADQLLATKVVSLDLASGKSITVPVNFAVEATDGEIFLANGKYYAIVSEVVPVSGGGVDELFSDDNTAALRSFHYGAMSFGAVNGRTKTPITVEGPNGPVTFTLSGRGTGTVSFDADGKIDLGVSGTNASSSISVKSKTSGQYVDDVILNSAIGSVKFGTLNVIGDFAATGGARSIVLGDLGDPAADSDRDFSVNVFPIAKQKISVTLGMVHDYSFTSLMPVGKLVAKGWENDEALTGPNRIYAAGLDVLRVTGNLEADVSVSSEARVAQIVVGGSLNNSTITTLGNINSIKLGSMIGSNIFAGLSAKPEDLEDFLLHRAIGSFSVTGTFADSVVAASTINSIVLENVDKTAGEEVKGFYADAIKSYLRKGVDGVKFTKLGATNVVDEDANYEVRLF